MKPKIRVGFSPTKNEFTKAFTTGLTSTTKLRANKFMASHVGFCPRHSSILVDVPEEFTATITPSSHMYMTVGTSYHELMGKAFQNSKVLVGKEIRVELAEVGPPSLKPLSGYIDFLVKNEDGRFSILDLKTCGNLPNEPKREHMAQLQVYSLISGIGSCFLYYLSRNVAKWDGEVLQKIFQIPCEEDDLIPIAKNLAVAHVFAHHHVIPPIPTYLKSEKDCGFCPFTQMCWKREPYPGIFEPYSKKHESLYDEARTLAKDLIASRPLRESEFLKRTHPA